MRKVGDEPITFRGKPIGYAINDFWSWNCSDLLNNTLRGEYAEFIVAAALGLDLSVERINWEPWDLTYPFEWRDTSGKHSEIRVEVKSSSYLQSWKQNQLSTILFGIRPTRLLNPNGRYSNKACRQADVYVFCVYAEVDPEKADPMVLDSWEFYAISSRKLNENCGSQKTIALSSLLKFGPIKADFAGVESAVRQCVQAAFF